MNSLQYRLEHCLQSLLEIQPALRLVYRRSLAGDFRQLYDCLGKVERMDLNEEDVRRLERMTEEFMLEARHAGAFPLSPKQAH